MYEKKLTLPDMSIKRFDYSPTHLPFRKFVSETAKADPFCLSGRFYNIPKISRKKGGITKTDSV